MQDSIYHPVLMSLSSPSHKKFTEEGDAMDSLSLPSLQHSPSREEFMNAGGETLGYTPGLLQTRIQLQGGVRSMRKKIDGGESVVPKISSLRCGRILNPKDLYFWSLLHLGIEKETWDPGSTTTKRRTFGIWLILDSLILVDSGNNSTVNPPSFHILVFSWRFQAVTPVVPPLVSSLKKELQVERCHSL